MIRQEIIKLIQEATSRPKEGIHVEHPEDAGFGDYSTNIALQLKRPATEIVKKLKVKEDKSSSPPFANARVVEEDKSSSPPFARLCLARVSNV